MSREIIKNRAQSNKLLTPRLKINEKCQSKDFQSWLLSRIEFRPGDKILDLCCGNGAQSIPFSKRIGLNGHLTCVDINTDSIEYVESLLGQKDNVDIINSEMMDTSNYLSSEEDKKFFNLIHCSFALPYAKDPLKLMEILYEKLTPNGIISVSLPCEPHGMVNFCKKFHPIPKSVLEAINLGENDLISHMRNSFGEVDISYFNSKLIFQNLKDFLEIYRCTTYYNHEFEEAISNEINKKILVDGYVEFDKCAILINGKDFPHGGITI